MVLFFRFYLACLVSFNVVKSGLEVPPQISSPLLLGGKLNHELKKNCEFYLDKGKGQILLCGFCGGPNNPETFFCQKYCP